MRLNTTAKGAPLPWKVTPEHLGFRRSVHFNCVELSGHDEYQFARSAAALVLSPHLSFHCLRGMFDMWRVICTEVLLS